MKNCFTCSFFDGDMEGNVCQKRDECIGMDLERKLWIPWIPIERKLWIPNAFACEWLPEFIEEEEMKI